MGVYTVLAVQPKETSYEPTDAEVRAYYERHCPPGSPPLDSLFDHIRAAILSVHQQTEPRDDWESGTEAAAWGAWDGKQAMGGALPTGTSNQVAELAAVERVLARHEAGDKILIGGDCQSALGMIEGAWRGGVIGAEACTDDKLGGLLVEAITWHRLRITAA